MAFREIARSEYVSTGRTPQAGTVNALILKTGQIRFALAEDISESLGKPEAVRIMIGDGEHTGHIAIVPATPSKSGSFKVRRASRSRQSVIFVGAKRLSIPPFKRSTVSLPFKASPTGIVVDVRPLAAPVLAAVA